MAIVKATTMVEWPSEKKNPTAIGRFFSCISLRVTLSIAEIWSASTEWRKPKVYASSAVPSSAGYCTEKPRSAKAHARMLKAIRSTYIAMIFLRRLVELSLNTCVSGVIPKFLLMKPPIFARCTKQHKKELVNALFSMGSIGVVHLWRRRTRTLPEKLSTEDIPEHVENS